MPTPTNETDDMPIDYGNYMEVTSAVTGRRVFVNKLAIMYINEVDNNGACDIWFDKDMFVPAQESYDDVVDLLLEDEEENYD